MNILNGIIPAVHKQVSLKPYPQKLTCYYVAGKGRVIYYKVYMCAAGGGGGGGV